MFDDLLESTNEKKKTNKGWSVILSGLVQTVILGILVLIPLIYTEALPKAMLSTLLIAPPPPPPPPPPPAVVKTIIKPVARLIQSGKLMQPRAIPKEVAVFKEAELPPDVINNYGCRRAACSVAFPDRASSAARRFLRHRKPRLLRASSRAET